MNLSRQIYRAGNHLTSGQIRRQFAEYSFFTAHRPTIESQIGRADQFSTLRGTGILPVAEKHGQDARATPNVSYPA